MISISRKLTAFVLIVWLSFVSPALGGPVSAVVVRADGWSADVTVTSTSLGTFTGGMGPNNNPSTATVAIDVSGTGYDDNLNLVVVGRKLYGTMGLLKPYPNQAQLDQAALGGDVTFRLGLSDYLFSGDTVATATCLNGAYTGSTSSTTGVGNNSTVPYPKVIACWNWPGFERITSATRFSISAYHAYARNGRPVRAVKFIVSDGTTSNSEIVRSPICDRTIGDAVPIVEYRTITDLTAGLTQGALLTVNFEAYPWVGDSTAVFRSADNPGGATPKAGPKNGLCDRTGAYAKTAVLVNSSTGNDSTGTAYDAASFSESSAAPCATIYGALAKALARNNANGHNDLGAVTIYLQVGDHTWTGGTGALGSAPPAWPVITRAPSASRDSVRLFGKGGLSNPCDKFKIQDVKVVANGFVYFENIAHLWFDQCNIDQTGYTDNPIVYGNTHWYVTRSEVRKINQGLCPYFTESSPLCLLRGNTLWPQDFHTRAPVVIGNKKTAPGACGSFVFNWAIGSAVETMTDVVFACNRIENFDGNVGVDLSQRPIIGCAIVQNLVEMVGTSGWRALSICADDNTTDARNVLFFGNTVIGQRINICYASEPGTYVRDRFFSRNNVTHNINTKSDVFAADGSRTYNWAYLHGVGCSGNFLAESTGIGAPLAFNQRFTGLHTYRPGSAVAANFCGWLDLRSFNGSVAGSGNGNYHLAASTPMRFLTRDHTMPFDLDGNYRASSDVPGAYRLYTAGE